MKAIIFIFLFILSVSFGFSQNLQEGLVLYLPFNNNCEDYSGNNFDGINFNAEFTDDPWGNPFSACYFNGYNTHVELPNEPALKPPLPMSFSFWVKFFNLNADDSQIFITDFSKNMYAGVWFGLNPDSYQMQMSYGSGIENCTGPECRRTITGNTVFQTNTWYHIVGVIQSSNSMNLYVNCGNDGGYYSGSGSYLAYTTSLGSIGRTDQVGLTPYYFNGVLDEFYYWNRALTLAEIVQTCGLTDVQAKAFDGINETIKISVGMHEESIIIESPSEIEGATYTITDLKGLVVQEGYYSTNHAKIAVSGLNDGIHILTLNLGNTIKHYKFMKL